MARKRKSDFERIVLVASKLPWWVCLGLAVAAWFVLHPLAGRSSPPPTDLNELSRSMGPIILNVFALIGQYVLPALFMLAGITSFSHRWKARRLHDRFVHSEGATAELDWSEFEQLVGELYRRKGYRVAETVMGPDGGIDLVLTREAETYLVQCKHWKGRPVGVKVVRELKGVIAARGASGGSVVASGGFTAEAKQFARKAGVELVDGEALRSLPERDQPEAPHDEPEPDAGPCCPACGSPMVRRRAGRGPNAGKEFWGCSSFPKCRSTVAI